MPRAEITHGVRISALLMLLVSPVLVVSATDGTQPLEFIHGNSQSSTGLSFFFISEQQQAAAQGARVMILSSAGSQGSGGGPEQLISSALEAQSPQDTPSIPSQTPGDGFFVLFQEQNGQTLIIIRTTTESNGLTTVQVASQPPRLWLDPSRRRSRFGIVVEILSVLKEGPMTPYELGFMLRLNDKRAKSYIEMLEEKGLVESTDRDGRTAYSVTTAGKVLVESLKTAFEMRSQSPIKDSRSVFSDLL